MRKFKQISIFISLLFIWTLLISSTVLVFAKVPEGSSLSTKEEILLDDFEGFQVNDLMGDISISSDSDELSFCNNNLSIHQAYVGYGLSFDLFGNVTDVEVSFDIHYKCHNASGTFMFFGHLGTYFDSYDGDYSRSLEGNLVNCGIVRDYSGFFGIYDGYYTSELFFGDEEQLHPSSFPLEDTITFTITKKGRVATTSITNSIGESLYSFERKSAFIYAYTSGFHFWYSAFQDTQFTVEVSSFTANLVVEQRDWRSEANLDKIVNIVFAVMITLIVLGLISTTVIVIIRSKSYKARKEKQQNKEQRVLEAKYQNLD